MAHELEQMAYVGETPWHGLGNILQPDSTIDEWVTQAGLDWTVSKRQVLYPTHDGDSSPAWPFKDKFVLARDTDDRAFSVVSNRYKIVQPKQIVEFFRDLVQDFGMQIETAGSLRDGQRVWALAKTGEAHKVMGVDHVDSYLMLATSYDLTFSTLAQFTSVRVVCNNTLQQSFKNHSSRIVIPHMKDFDADDIKNQLGIGRSQWESFTQTLDVLANIRLDVAKASEIMHNVYKMDTAPAKEAAANVTHIAQIIDLFNGRAIGSDIAGQTGWGLVNAASEYLDQKKRARSVSNRLDSAWFGEGFNLKQATVDHTLALAA